MNRTEIPSALPAEFDPELFLEIAVASGAVLRNDHFVLRSGHSPDYFDKDALFAYPHVMRWMCRALARRFAASNIQTVIGPATGGISLASILAEELTTLQGTYVNPVYTKEDASGRQKLKSPVFALHLDGRRTISIEDVGTSGGSQRQTNGIALAHGAILIGSSLCVNRGKSLTRPVIASAVNTPILESLILPTHFVKRFGADVFRSYDNGIGCPGCLNNAVPVNAKHGHGTAWLAKNAHASAGNAAGASTDR